MTPSSVCSRRGRGGPGTPDEGRAGTAVPVGQREVAPTADAALTSPPLTLGAPAPRASSVVGSTFGLHRAGWYAARSSVSSSARGQRLAASSCREPRARADISSASPGRGPRAPATTGGRAAEPSVSHGPRDERNRDRRASRSTASTGVDVSPSPRKPSPRQDESHRTPATLGIASFGLA